MNMCHAKSSRWQWASSPPPADQWNFMTTAQLNAIEGSDRPCFKFIKFEVHPRYLAQVLSDGIVQMNNFAAAPHLQVMSEVNLGSLPWAIRAYVSRGQLECFKLHSEDIYVRRCQEQVVKLGKSLLEAARNAQDALDELKDYKHKLDENEWAWASQTYIGTLDPQPSTTTRLGLSDAMELAETIAKKAAQMSTGRN